MTMDVREKLVKLLKSVLPNFRNNMAYWGEKPIYEFADCLLANGVTVQEWISVEDRLPEEKVNCIVHYQHSYCDNDDYWAIGICFYDGEKFQMDWSYKVTHWMPLPKPPKGAYK